MPSGKKQTSEQYAQAFQLGEEKAYDYFFRLYFRSLCYFARNILHHTHDAEDLVQECFAKLWHKHSSLNNPSSIRNFLYSTVRNACIDLLRKKKQYVNSCNFEESITEDPQTVYEDTLIKAEVLREIYKSMESLPARMKEVFQLYYLQGKNDREISELLNISPNTVRNQRTRALAWLRKKITVP